MANGFVFGKGRTPSVGVGEWSFTTIEVPQLSGNLWWEDGTMNMGVLADYTITYPLTFKDRTFNNRTKLLAAVGSWGNVLLSSDDPSVSPFKGISQWESCRIFSFDTATTISPFTLYVYAKFTD